MSADTCTHGKLASEPCAACDDLLAGHGEPVADSVNPEPSVRPVDAPSAQDAFLERMRFAAGALLAKPSRELSKDELELFINGAMALAEMFTEMDRHLSNGAASPTAWQMDRSLVVDEAGIPSSEKHIELKAQIESGTMELVRQFEKLGNKTGARLSQALGRILILQGRLISESVRIAVAHRIKPSQVAGGAPDLMVRGVARDSGPTKIEPVTTKRGRTTDQEG